MGLSHSPTIITNGLVCYIDAGAAGPNGISLGSYGNNTEYSACQIGFLLVYNRVLSDTEITQVYDHFKSRYGLG